MNSKPVHRQRQITKKSTRLTVEFLEKRVVLDADPIGDVIIDGSPLEGQEVATPDTLADTDSLGTITTAISYSPVYTTINERNFGYYVPESYDPSTPTPLLFMFHGMGGDSSEQSGGSAENGYYGWQTTAHENGFIVLFPESLGFLKTWDLGAGGSSSDLAFVDDMIDWASTNYNISTSQIFTTGHSWGAYFSYYVARYRSDDIAAFGAHSGGLGGAFFLGSTPPVPTGPSPTPTLNGIVLHAVDDGIVPYSNSQNLYDDLVANGHNVYDDGIGNDGIIEVDGWGPDNHRYRRQHNQTQWDFFLSVSSTPETPNQPPALNKPLDLILNENASPQSIALTGITSGNGDVQPVRVTAVSDNPGLIPDPTVTYSSPDATGTLAFTPVANQHGTATITVTVEDPGTDGDFNTTEDNLTVRQTFNVTVTQVNDAPTLNDIAASTNEDVPVDISLNATDIDSTTLTYAVTNDPIGGSVSVVDGVATYAPFADFFGTDSFVVTVNDNHPTDPRTDAATVTVNVASVNDAPTLTPLSNLVLAEDSPTQLIRLVDITAGGGEEQPLFVDVQSSNTTLISNASVSFLPELGADMRLLGFSPNPSQYGAATLTVTVTDGGFDNDLTTPDDNATFSQSFDVTVTPHADAPPASPTPLQRMFIHESRSGDTVATYHIPAMNINGEPVNGLATRLTATSSDANLIPHPVTVYASTDVAGALSFTPVVGAAGTATLTVQVEDGGPDNSFANADDNRQATHAIEVTVLDILSEDGTAILSQDGSGNIYADTQPIVHRDEQSKININEFSALAAESDDGGNALIVRREMTDYRLIADETWKISSLFHSLGNTNVQELDISARGSAYISEVAISNEGAFMVAGVEAPTITVRRNETYTFDLNTPNHPFYLQTAGGGYQESLVYAAGFDGNGHTSGRYTWNVPDDAPDELFYQSGVDENVFGRIVVIDVPGDD